MTVIDFFNLIKIFGILIQVLIVVFFVLIILYVIDVIYEKRKEKVLKRVFEQLEERLASHTFDTKSEDYTDGFFDAIGWVDGEIIELKKEIIGEDDYEESK